MNFTVVWLLLGSKSATIINMKRIVTTNSYCREVFGEKLYKLTLSAATSCPNRDAGAGCVFCSAGGSGEFAAPVGLPIEEQIEFAKTKIRDKYKGNRFIAYFQSYTGTYGDIERLEQIYWSVATREDIAAISIATRPDCLGERVVEMLRRIAKVKPLWVELGLQTSSEHTARLIRRGYPYAEYQRAVAKLRTVGAHIITHIILGLPSEDREQMLASVRAAAMGDGIKLQLLHILKGTELERWYYAGHCRVMNAEEYYELVADALEILPEGCVVHRMTGDGDKRLLIAPKWCADKKRVINDLHKVLKNRGFVLK